MVPTLPISGEVPVSWLRETDQPARILATVASIFREGIMLEGVLLDLGGVVYIGDRTLARAVESIERLRSTGLPVRFVTNVTRQSRRQQLKMLTGMGLQVDANELIMPAIAARDYLRHRRLSPHLLVHPALE
jgi:ribonucleotide monophosphatase NagD (HAD superfamily)